LMKSVSMPQAILTNHLNVNMRMNLIAMTQQRYISTSEKKKDHPETTSLIPGINETSPRGPKTVEEFADTASQKNWVSWGFDIGDKALDRFGMSWTFFWLITVAMTLGPYIVMYQPDFRFSDWSKREAFIELHRREKLGLPLIDKNFLDPAKIKLPTEEELGDTDVII